ncbi:MAG: hypothetical protein A2Z42_02585 [Candidatus Woykebacteria bacterium RBG_19FT_COMBO_43_10]|uniref:HTH HARE-type domain-containing protein n=1 Tax=Candidatus Woykebacteria bacterium RBG_19FT_COMBO_43_10 TaxID=1802598 RepID=A0A1G1WK47_9BACT|nr:MAG: hypothetical protein A2Z42_02585 [Candidatus Woykebacteria bacterium RBG_19FT_COMBO_43_10]
MARRAKIPIGETHVSRAVKTKGGRASLEEITQHIWQHYHTIVRPEIPELYYGAFRVLKDRVSGILTRRKGGSFRNVNGKWEEIKQGGKS